MKTLITDFGFVFELGIANTLNDVGRDAGLTPLEWDVTASLDVIMLVGRPAFTESIIECEAWADLLGMKEYERGDGEGSRAWLLDNGKWWIELIARPHLG